MLANHGFPLSKGAPLEFPLKKGGQGVVFP